MSIAVQIRRGTASQNTSFTGAVGELIYTTDDKKVYVHDGSTSGGTIVSGGGAGTTNLTTTANGTSLTVNSDTGTNASIPAATTSAWGAMTDEDKAKLDGVAASANNYSHPNHTGDVTSTGDGATVIANNAVTSAKLATTLDFGSIV